MELSLEVRAADDAGYDDAGYDDVTQRIVTENASNLDANGPSQVPDLS